MKAILRYGAVTVAVGAIALALGGLASSLSANDSLAEFARSFSGPLSAAGMAGWLLNWVWAPGYVLLRHRVQVVVDRRFDRARDDAHQVVEHFGGRLRDDLDLDGLDGDLRAVVASTVQPTQVWLWLRPNE